MSDSRFSEILRARGIQGLILGPLDDGARCPELSWKDFSAVRIGVPLRESPVRTICHDNYFASMVAVEECLLLGYKRLGLVIRKRHSGVLQHRWEAGFMAAIPNTKSSVHIPPRFSMTGRIRQRSTAWFQQYKPDVIVTPDYEAISEARCGAQSERSGRIWELPRHFRVLSQEARLAAFFL